MAKGILELDDLTLSPEEAREVSKAVFEYVLEVSDIAKYHDIHTGIQWDEQIVFIGTLGLVGKEILDCKIDANGNKIPFSEKTWSPKLIGDRFEHCAKEVNPLFKLFKKVKRVNPDFFNRIDSEELGVILMRIAEAMQDMIYRLIWFGDKDAKNVSDSGVFKDGTNLKFFNPFDGFWKQIISEDIPTTSKYYVEIEENGKDTYDEQMELPKDFAFNLFRSMWKKADSRLKQLIKKGAIKPVVHCTGEIAENWQDFKEDKSLGFTLKNVEEGELKEMFRKIEVVTHYGWDAIIQGYQDNGTKYNLPNRALLTVSGNIPIGTVNEEDLEKIESFYDKYHKVNVMDFALKLDAKFLQDYLAVAAY